MLNYMHPPCQPFNPPKQPFFTPGMTNRVTSIQTGGRKTSHRAAFCHSVRHTRIPSPSGVAVNLRPIRNSPANDDEIFRRDLTATNKLSPTSIFRRVSTSPVDPFDPGRRSGNGMPFSMSPNFIESPCVLWSNHLNRRMRAQSTRTHVVNSQNRPRRLLETLFWCLAKYVYKYATRKNTNSYAYEPFIVSHSVSESLYARETLPRQYGLIPFDGVSRSLLCVGGIKFHSVPNYVMSYVVRSARSGGRPPVPSCQAQPHPAAG